MTRAATKSCLAGEAEMVHRSAWFSPDRYTHVAKPLPGLLRLTWALNGANKPVLWITVP